MAELVTGHAGKAHATAEQAAGLNAGILGLDDYVLNVHNKFEITVVSANKVTIGTGELVMQGRHVSQGTPEDLIVANGSQGQKRNDLIVCRYAKGSQNIESAKLVVVRGTPTTGTPTDPAVNTTSPLDGGTTYDMPLYRIPLDGITIGTPVALFNVLKPMSDVWDSLTPTRYTFSNPERSQVIGRVQDRDRIVGISGMTVLGSGTLCPIPFLHPQYPMRAVSVSIATSGDISILYGDEVTLTSGYLDVYTDAG